MKKLDKRLAKVVSEVFNMDIESLHIDTSPNDINSWDSLGHLKLIMAIEEEFDIKFESEEIFKLTTLGDIQNKLKKEGKI